LPSIKNSAARNQVDFNTYGVSDTSRNIFVAWDFLKFATSSKEQAIYLNQTRGLSPRLDLAKTESKQGDLSPFAAQLPESHTWALAGWPETAQAFQGSMAGVLTNKSTSAQALEQSKAQLTPLLQALTP
jgi:ABC-type glycerol-3-phosphate transport system substrate-binding protein